MSYATPAQAAAPFAPVQFTLGVSSKPSNAQVQEWLDAHSVVLDNKVEQVGYLIPDSGTDAYRWLTEANRLYVGAQLGYSLLSGPNESNQTADNLKKLYDEMWLQLERKELGGIFEPNTSVACIGGADNFPEAVLTDDIEW